MPSSYPTTTIEPALEMAQHRGVWTPCVGNSCSTGVAFDPFTIWNKKQTIKSYASYSATG